MCEEIKGKLEEIEESGEEDSGSQRRLVSNPEFCGIIILADEKCLFRREIILHLYGDVFGFDGGVETG